MPKYSLIFLPSIDGVVVTIMVWFLLDYCRNYSAYFSNENFELSFWTQSSQGAL